MKKRVKFQDEEEKAVYYHTFKCGNKLLNVSNFYIDENKNIYYNNIINFNNQEV